jgi:hypothetical protein
MKTILIIAIILMICLAPHSWAQLKKTFVISDFSDPAKDGPKFGMGDSGDIVKTIEPRAQTDLNNMLKVVFKSGRWPGFHVKVPQDWSPYEAIRFVVWSKNKIMLNVRIDDPKSSSYSTRFNKTIQLNPGQNLCQIKVDDIGRVLDRKKIRAFILFLSSPPKGMTLYFDDITLGPVLAETIPFIPYEKRRDLQPTLKVVTPHIPFAKGITGGPLRAFMLSGIIYGREIPEMMQRMDLDVKVMTWDRNWDSNTWGMGDFYGKRGHAFDVVLMQRYIASTLQGPEKFEVLVMSTPQGWERFPKGARTALIDRVKNKGEGLVLILPYPGKQERQAWPDDLKEISALINGDTDYIDPNSGYIRYGRSGHIRNQTWKIAKEHPITAGVPLEAIPMKNIEIKKYDVAPGAEVLIQTQNGAPILAVKQLGKGRVATFAWRSHALTPGIGKTEELASKIPYRYWEPVYSLMCRAALWAAGRTFERKDKPINVSPVAEKARYYSHFEKPYLQVKQWKDSKGKVTDWEMIYTPPGKTGIIPIEITAPQYITRGDDVQISFAVPKEMILGDPGKASCFASIYLIEKIDGSSRILEMMPSGTPGFKKEGKQLYKVTLPSSRVRQIMAYIKIIIFKTNKCVAQGEKEIIVAPKYKKGESRWQEYEILMWPVGGLPFLAEYDDRRMREIGCTGVMYPGWRSASGRMRWSRAGLRMMPHCISQGDLHIRPYRFAPLVEKWTSTGDRSVLIRKPSFADPVFLKKAHDRLAGITKTLKQFNPTNYVLSDEPSLTCYAKDFDFDFHPENIKWFIKRMEAKFKTIKNLNAALGTAVDSWDKIDPPVSKDARKNKSWSLWNEWRAHNDFVMAEGYRMYRDAVLQEDPNGTISVSGTQSATSFDGFDWGLLSPLFGTMQGYGYNHQDRKRMSFNPDMRNATPAGYGRSGRAVNHQIWSKLIQHGGGHVLFWWISFRNPDLTFCRSAEDYQQIFKEMRSGIGKQYMQARRLFSPVAILYSMNSIRATYMQGNMSGRGGSYHSTENSVVTALIKAGFDPQFITDTQVSKGELKSKNIKALFMPMTLSLGYGDKQGGFSVVPEIKKYMDQGGVVVATNESKYDEFLKPRKPDPGFIKNVVKFDAVKENLGETLSKSGIVPRMKALKPDGSPVPGMESCLHIVKGKADGYLATLLRKPLGSKEVLGADGVLITVPDKSGGNEKEPVVLDISRLGDMTCYNTRTHEQLKPKKGKLSLEVQAGDACSVALLPYAVDKITAETEIKDRMLNISFKLHSRSKAFVPHVVRIEVGDEVVARKREVPEGPTLTVNAVAGTNGQGTVQIPLAIEDLKRKLEIRLKDTLTGVNITIKP